MLRTSIGGVDLPCCIYNASGPRTGSAEALTKIALSRSGAVLSKSATLVKQDGNTLPRFVNKIKLGGYCDGSLNSEGLPNYGIDYCKNVSAFVHYNIFSISDLILQIWMQSTDQRSVVKASPTSCHFPVSASKTTWKCCAECTSTLPESPQSS